MLTHCLPGTTQAKAEIKTNTDDVYVCMCIHATF